MTFRMDTLHADNVSHTVRGTGNVLLRRAALVLCCDAMAGQADASWAWRTITCTGHVRASRPGERAWADVATYDPQTQTLTLTGAPRIRRGGSMMHGKKIVMHVQDQRIDVMQPQGALRPDGADDGPNLGEDLAPSAALPAQCLVPWLK